MGEPIYPDTVTTLMTKLIRAHNEPENGPRPKDQLPHARLHDLRHIHATTLLLSGVPVHVVAARLGHADPAITLRVYAHVMSRTVFRLDAPAACSNSAGRSPGGCSRHGVVRAVDHLRCGGSPCGMCQGAGSAPDAHGQRRPSQRCGGSFV